jgi:hypothetical protein
MEYKDYLGRNIIPKQNCLYIRKTPSRYSASIELRKAYIVELTPKMVKICYKFKKKHKITNVASNSLILLNDKDFPDIMEEYMRESNGA